MSNIDALIIGCGFSGAVCARVLAEGGKKVLILEKRDQIAGNMYDFVDDNGVLVHLFGPHIFHTNNKTVFDFLSRFTEFTPYKHCVLGRINSKLVPIPFNFKSIDILFDKDHAEKCKQALKDKFNDKTRVTISELLSCDGIIRKIGEFVYENVFLHYTAKQWGMPIEKVDTSVINRVPVVLSYESGYFSDKYQFMPQKGFTNLFENLLNHENIAVKTGVNALTQLNIDTKEHKVYFNNELFNGTVVSSAPIDEFFNNIYGKLPYRSLDLKFEKLKQNSFQGVPVVNYPNEEDFTRITEFKYLTSQKCSNTTILKEYPHSYNSSDENSEPYYPIINRENLDLYNRYNKLSEEFNNLFFCGRLAQYKYFNMDTAVESALNLSEKILNK